MKSKLDYFDHVERGLCILIDGFCALLVSIVILSSALFSDGLLLY